MVWHQFWLYPTFSSTDILSIGENEENRHAHILLGVEIGNTTLEGNMAVSIKILNNYDLVLSLIRFHPWEVLVQLHKGAHKKCSAHTRCLQ